MDDRPKIILRADGNSAIGLGHVIRSLALAEMLKDDFECVFAIQQASEALQQQIKEVCTQLILLPLCAKEEKGFIYELDAYITGNEIVVLDGYAFETGYQKHIKEKGCPLVCIDDIHAYHFVADVIINHSGGHQRAEYSLEPYTQCYLGPQYALLRSPFLKSHTGKKASGSLQNLFINMGGADPSNNTCDILKKVIPFDFFEEIHVVTGLAFVFQKELEQESEKDKRVTLHQALNAVEIATLMQKCKTGICPPSSVSFEYMSIGGLLFLKQIAENQTTVKKFLLEQRAALDFDKDFENVLVSDPYGEYEKSILKQDVLLDGKSDERLVALFNTLNLMNTISCRPVQEKDILKCYEWANDGQVRSASYNSSPISKDDHIRWFNKKINDLSSQFYIVEQHSKSIGQIRFDGEEEKMISYLIAPEMRGKGLGSIILRKGVEQLVKDSEGVQKISGYVKKDNISSCKAFERAGFAQIRVTDVLYPDSVKYELLIKS